MTLVLPKAEKAKLRNFNSANAMDRPVGKICDYQKMTIVPWRTSEHGIAGQ